MAAPEVALDRYETGAILNDIGSFDMGNFKVRPTLQKAVCLLQPLELNPGYVFKRRLRGMHRPIPANGGFAMGEMPPSMPTMPAELESEQARHRCPEFRDCLADKNDDPAMLEALSPISHLDGPGMEKGEIPKSVKGEKSRLGMEEGRAARGDLWRDGVEGHRNG